MRNRAVFGFESGCAAEQPVSSLGERTGAELAERLADQGQDRPFLVLMTGYATEMDDPSLLSRGVDAVLPKPSRGDDLRQVLSRARPRSA